LWEGAEQALLGRGGIPVIHAAQVEGVMKAEGPGSVPSPEALARRFGARWAIQLRATLDGDALRVTLDIWEDPHSPIRTGGTVEGRLSAPEGLLRALRQRLRATLGLESGPPPNPGSLPRSLEVWKAYAQGLEGLEAGDPGRLATCLTHLRRSLEADPAFLPAQIHLAIGLGEQYVQAGWFAPASSRHPEFLAYREAVQQAQTLDANHPMVRMLTARLEFVEQQFKAAIAHSEAVLKEDPYLVDAEITIADAYQALPIPEAREQARQRLERVIALGDARFYPNFRLTAVNLQSGNLDRAFEQGDKLIQGWPDRVMSYVMASNALLWLDRPQEARARIEVGLKRFPEAKLLHRNLAYAAFQTRDMATLERELAFAEQAWSEEQSTAILLRGLRPAAQRDLTGTQDVFATLLKRLERPRGTTGVESLAGSVDLYFMARTLATLGAPDKGRPYLEAAERLYPNWSQPTRMDPAFR
jgi:tetratricopeptide (TPR) repeat protein